MVVTWATRVTWSYRVLRGGYRWSTGGNRGLQSITGGYRGYRGLHGVLGGYKGYPKLQGITGGGGGVTEGLQGVTMD